MLMTLMTAVLLSAAPATPVAPPDTLTLEWLERETLARNPSLAAMHAAADAARARSRQGSALQSPMVESAFAPASFGGDAGWRIEATQSFAPFGTRGLERDATRFEAGAAASEADVARLDLLREVRGAFFDLYRVARASETNVEQTRLMKQFRSVALTRYAAGSEGQQDALEADAELAMLAHQEASLRREQRVLDARLNALLHRSASDTLSPPPLKLELPGEPLGVTISEAYSPEIAAADARVEAERSRVSATGRARLPLVKLGAAWDRFMLEPDWRGQVIAGVELPLWGGRGGPAKDEARADLARAEFERDARNDERGRAIEEARAEYEESHHEIEVMEMQLVPTSERALAAARVGFESGRGNFLALILATRRRGDAKLELEAARVRAANGWASLRRATAADLTADGTGAPREEQGR